jgi:acetyl esterase/lipase
MLTIPEFEPLKVALPCLLFWTLPTVVKNIEVYRRGKWLLDFDDVCEIGLVRHTVVSDRHQGIRCKYLLSGMNGEDKSLVLALHGGGFVGQSPEMHEMYTRHWACQMPGIPILSVDYSHAPENKFPVALQEILDVYLWLTSEEHADEVKSKIGFVPDRIVLVGDSAGGNLAMAITLILSDIRHQSRSEDNFKMISGVVTCYANFNVKPAFCPSHFLTSCDPFLSAMVLFNLIDAYAPTKNAIRAQREHHEKLEDHEWSSGRVMPLIAPTNGMLTSLWASARWLNPFTRSYAPNAWFACSKEELLTRIEAFGDILDHPYMSPIKYEHFERLKDVSCHLIPLLYDPLLDDSIEMAKKWTGPVTVDCLDGLNHGFLHFIHNSQEAMAGCDLVLHRIKQALKIY